MKYNKNAHPRRQQRGIRRNCASEDGKFDPHLSRSASLLQTDTSSYRNRFGKPEKGRFGILMTLLVSLFIFMKIIFLFFNFQNFVQCGMRRKNGWHRSKYK